mmetsp:Transcript_18973/g.55041  ORF Transcript_18973/g.55041 Transcript_18973/m.55041 type:complete len:204 (+) Transcript_18973:1044-1655(+)
MTAWRPASGSPPRARPRLRCRKAIAGPALLPDASPASVAASTASMAASLLATASTRCRRTEPCTNRIVLPVVFSVTTPLRMPTAAVKALSSSRRTWTRWSQDLALSPHIVCRSMRYSWSSRSVAATVVRSWLFEAICSCFRCFSDRAVSSWRSLPSMKSCFACRNCSCAATAATSAVSTLTFSARKSVSSCSRVWMMLSERKV